ncbi:RNA exonuclease 5-like [Physella acuta]|uniref:RNA exonuclease 5-like n=1 Tax=Physella acuta TaxID=109671 RepID=UPI0027DD710E|nr:RNA exonuclease 5-like [Physella acuta]
MDHSLDREGQLLSTRKLKRLESKKRKAVAFLSLLSSSATAAGTRSRTLRRTSAMSATVQTEAIELLSHPPEQKMEITKGEGDDDESSKDPLLEMKKVMRERKRMIMQKPKLFLTLEETVPFRTVSDEPISEEEYPPLFVMDLQQLLLYGIQGNMASFKPRWCKLLRVAKVSSVVLLMIDGLSHNDYTENKTSFKFISGTFESLVEMVCPLQYGQSLDSELYNVPLSVSQLKKVNVRVPKSIRDKVFTKIDQPVAKNSNDKLSRTCLLLSTYQMMLEGYPLPIITNKRKYHNFVYTKDCYKKVTASSPMFALDCEMCLTSIRQNELTRVSIVAENGDLLFDSFVKPKNRIINYLTRYSGITKEILDPVKTTLEDVQNEIRRLLPADAILCGQSLNCDLLALKMFHPYVIDTSIIFNMSGNRKVKAGLRKLTQFFLGRTIQANPSGHCSTEDAIATLDLVKLKLSKGLEFGDATLSGIYFPDIRTYFTENSGGSSKTASENVELESSELADRNDNCSMEIGNSLLKRDHSGEMKSHNEQQLLNFKANGSSSSSSSDSEDESSLANQSKKQKLSQDDSSCSQTESDSKINDVPIVPSFKSTIEKVQLQQCLFNQANSVHVSHSFFKLVNEAGRTACMIDRDTITEKYSSECIEKITVTTDSEARRAAKSFVQSKEFVWAQFHDFNNTRDLLEESRQKLMRKLDNRVQSVVKRVKPNSLVAVVMTGRESVGETAHNMAVLVTIT